MSISIAQFKNAARTEGTFTTNQTGDNLVKAPTSFKGKVTAFFRGLFKPGTVAEENRGVMNAFITSLKNSKFQYGEGYGDMAARMLEPDISSGKPLTGRKIKQVLDVMQERKEWLNAMDLQTAAPLTSLSQGSDFRTIFAQAMGEKNLPTDPDVYDTRDLRELINQKISNIHKNDSTRFMPISRTQAREIATEVIEQFATSRAKGYGVLRQALDKESTSFDAMQKVVFSSKAKIVEPGYIKGIVAMRGPLTEGVKSIVSAKSPEETFVAMKKLSDAINQKIVDMGMTPDLDTLTNFYKDCMSYVSHMGDVSTEEMQGFMDMMGSDKGAELRNSISAMTISEVRMDMSEATIKAGGQAQVLISAMVDKFGVKLGMDEETMSALAERPMVESSSVMSKNFRIMLEANGLAAPMEPGSILSRHGNNPFDKTFTDALGERLTSLYTDGEDSWDEETGLSNYMLGDVDRSTMTVDGRKVGGKMSKEDAISEWKKVFTDKDGRYDKKGARALSTIMHQGFYSKISTTLGMVEDGDGIKRPFVGNVGSQIQGENTNYTVMRDESTGDIWLTMKYTSKPQSLTTLDPDDPQAFPEVEFLNPETSKYEVTVQVRISRESIDADAPKVEVMASNLEMMLAPGKQPD